MRYFDRFLPTVPISEGEKSNNEVSEVVEDSCTELIDVSDYKCECDDKVDLDSESDTVSCQSFAWYVKHYNFKRAQCLKITENVTFNSASEASYVYTLH